MLLVEFGRRDHDEVQGNGLRPFHAQEFPALLAQRVEFLFKFVGVAENRQVVGSKDVVFEFRMHKNRNTIDGR